jgi:FkbM family methyltransferase
MAKNSLLLAYCVTSDKAYLSRLENTLVQQDMLDLKTQVEYLAADRVLFVNAPAEDLPRRIRCAFGDNIVTTPAPHVIAEGRRHFCLSKFRNYSIAYALDQGYEWLMLCDCDTVILPGSFSEPKTKYGVPDVYWQRSKDETINESLTIIQGSDTEIFSKGNSWFVLHRDLMSRIRFNENIFGYGWEDVEFDIRANACGFHLARVGIIVVHVYHSDTDRRIDPHAFARNEALVLTTKALLQRGYNPIALPGVDVVCGEHPHWSSPIGFLHNEKRVYLCRNRSWGSYTEKSNGNVVIQWDDYGSEEFRSADGLYYFISSYNEKSETTDATVRESLPFENTIYKKQLHSTPNRAAIIKYLIGASIPRSGHHFLAALLQSYYGDDLSYCESYTAPGCCRVTPCTRGGYHSIIYQKNHDFDFSLPKDIQDALYIVQYREPLGEVLSDLELELKNGSDLNRPYYNTTDHYMWYLALKAAYYRKFHDKWISHKVENAVYVDYADLVKNPAGATTDIIRRASSNVDESRVGKIISEARAETFKLRVIEDSPNFDGELLGPYEDYVLERCPAFSFNRHLGGSYRDHPIYGLFLLADTKEPLPPGSFDRLSAAAELAPTHPEVRLRLAERELRAGNDAIAMKFVADLMNPDNPYFSRARQLIVASYAKAGRQPVEPDETERVEELLRKAGKNAALLGNFTIVEAVHPHWNSKLALFEGTNVAIHLEHGTRGSFCKLGDDRLRIEWDDYPPEIFCRKGDQYVAFQELLGLDRPIIASVGQKPIAVASVILQPTNLNVGIEVRPGTSDITVFEAIFDRGEYLLHDLKLDASCIVDLGAYTGISSVFFAIEYPNARVIALEPATTNFYYLRRNISQLNNIRALQAAIWSEDAEVFVSNSEQQCPHWAFRTSLSADGSLEKVPTLSMVGLLRLFGLTEIDLLKIDIEGAEEEIFSKGAEIWLPRVKCLVIETHDRFREGVDSLVTAKMEINHAELTQRGENRVFVRRDHLKAC